jgi:hypothetical protein
MLDAQGAPTTFASLMVMDVENFSRDCPPFTAASYRPDALSERSEARCLA